MSDSSQATSQTTSQPAPGDGKAAAATTAPAAAPGTATAQATTTQTTAAPAAGETKPASAETKLAASETKPATGETKPPEGETKPAPAAPAIPETYELKIPTGDAYKGFKFDEALSPAMTPVFKAAKLTQEQVDALVPGFLEYQRTAPTRMLARDLQVTLKDPQLGGMNWGKTQGEVNEALAAFTTPEFRQKLERWGIANDLEFVRVFAAVGRAMRGDTAASGSPTTAAEESQADRIYGRAKKVGNAQ